MKSLNRECVDFSCQFKSDCSEWRNGFCSGKLLDDTTRHCGCYVCQHVYYIDNIPSCKLNHSIDNLPSTKTHTVIDFENNTCYSFQDQDEDNPYMIS